MKKNPWMTLVIIVIVFIGITALIIGVSGMALMGESKARVKSKNTLLSLKLEGIILDSQKFLKKLKKYKEDKSIRGILIRLDSPGGAVGAAEEIFMELKRVKEVYKKPIVVYSPNLNASGGYYVSMAADKIFVTKGALIGSIGVIMEFANLEKLYDWAHVTRYSITSGKFKDSGAEYRSMREDEKEYFQSLVLDAYKQFKGTVAASRKLKPEVLDAYTDGRVFSGAQAVELGFADKIGTQEDAEKALAQLAGLGDKYEIFEPPKPSLNLLEKLFAEREDEEYDSRFKSTIQGILGDKVDSLLRAEVLNRPMFLMPGFWSHVHSE